MTIGIGVNLGHTVVMVADGRERNYTKPGMPVCNDDLNKLTVIGDSIGVMTFGVSQVAEHARDLLSSIIHQCESSNQLIDFSRDCLERAWGTVLPTLNCSDPEDTRLATGLLLGGFINGVALVAKTVKSPLFETPSNLSTDTDSFLIGGGTQDDRFKGSMFFQVHFHARRRDAMPELTADETVDAAIECGAAMIRYIGESNNDVGGTIRYVVINLSGDRKGVYDG